MELQLTAKNIELTPETKTYIERKLGKLNRYLPNIMRFDVEIFEEKTRSPEQHFVVQVTIDSGGTLLRGEERAEQLFAAVDKVSTVMSRQIEHYKGKMAGRYRENSTIRTGAREPADTRRVVKVKRFPVKPMSLEEATDQMELLGHDFFLFRNADTEQLNLLYKRRDGNYGLIQPEEKQ